MTKNTVNTNSYASNFQYDDNSEIITKKMIWNNAVKTPKDFPSAQYWYKTGSEGKKQFYRIGCKAKYQIQTDNNKAAKTACKSLANEIKSCKEQYALGEALLVGTKVTAAAIAAIVIVNIFLPVATIVELVIAILGIAEYGASVKAIAKSGKHYLNVKDLYVEARTYGKKY